MLSIRPEQPDDLAKIRAIHLTGFPTAAEAELVDRLRAANLLVASLVAEIDEAIVGHVAFSPVQAASGATGAGLAPVAVLPPSRRRGVAAALIAAGLRACQVAGMHWCVVLGRPSYYSRFGFTPAARFGLCDEYGGGEAFAVLALSPGGIPTGGGLVRYAAPFAAFG